MLGMPGPLGTIVDLLAVMLGFGAIVFIHELGLFAAARWAGIRVLTFAVGFGPALVSYRRGIGLRKGSSEEPSDEVRHAFARRVKKGTGSPAPFPFRCLAAGLLSSNLACLADSCEDSGCNIVPQISVFDVDVLGEQ